MSLRLFMFPIVLFLLFIVNYTDHIPWLSYVHWKECLESFYHLILDIVYTSSPVLSNDLSFRSDFFKVFTWVQSWFRLVSQYNVTDTLAFRQCYNEMANTSIFYKSLHPDTQIVTAPTGFQFHNSVTMPEIPRQTSSQYLMDGSYFIGYVCVLFVVLTTILLVAGCCRRSRNRRRTLEILPRVRNSVHDEEKWSDNQETKQKILPRVRNSVHDEEKWSDNQETKQKTTDKQKDEAERKQGEQRKQREQEEKRKRKEQRKIEEKRKEEERRQQEEKRKEEGRRQQEEKRQEKERLEILISVKECKERGYSRSNNIPKGLPNLGNTCYLNSLLQVLSWTPLLGQKLAEQIWKIVGDDKIDIKNLSMDTVPTRLFSLLRNVHNKQNGDGNTVPRGLPFHVLEEARKLNDQFKGYRQQDSFEMFNTLMEGVENEARLAPLQQGANSNLTDMEVLMKKSPVSRLVGGTFVTVWYYESCQHVDLTFQRFTSVSVPVPKPQPVQTERFQSQNCSYVQRQPRQKKKGRNKRKCKSNSETVTDNTGASPEIRAEQHSKDVNGEAETLRNKDEPVSMASQHDDTGHVQTLYSRDDSTVSTFSSDKDEQNVAENLNNRSATLEKGRENTPKDAETENLKHNGNLESEQVDNTKDQAQSEQVDKSEDKAKSEQVDISEDQAQSEQVDISEDQAQSEQVDKSEDQAQSEQIDKSKDQAQSEQVDKSEDQAQSEQIDKSKDQAQSEQVDKSEDQAKSEQVDISEDQAQSEQVDTSKDQAQFEQVDKSEDQAKSEQIDKSEDQDKSEQVDISDNGNKTIENDYIPREPIAIAPKKLLVEQDTAKASRKEKGDEQNRNALPEEVVNRTEHTVENENIASEKEHQQKLNSNEFGSNVDGPQPNALILPHQPLEMMNENPTDIERGLRELTEEETWDESMIGCRTCKSSNSDTQGKHTRKKLLIIDLPPILVVHINKMERDDYGGLRKINRTVTYPKYLNMAPFCSSALQKIEVEYPSAHAWFRLYGVVSHGGSIHGGHYTAYVRVSHQNQSSLQTNFLATEWTDPERVEDDIRQFWEDSPHSHSMSPTDAPGDTTDEVWYHISDSMVWKSDEKAATNDMDAYILMYERCG